MTDEPEIKERTIEKIIKFIECPICKIEMKGSTDSQIRYNFNIHMTQKHKDSKEKIDVMKLDKNGK